jgi:hypothetical protein
LSDESRFVRGKTRRASGRTAFSASESRLNLEHRHLFGGDFTIFGRRPRPNALHWRRDACRGRAPRWECVFSSSQCAKTVEKSASSGDSVCAGASHCAFTDAPVESHGEQSASTHLPVASLRQQARPPTFPSRFTENKARLPTISGALPGRRAGPISTRGRRPGCERLSHRSRRVYPGAQRVFHASGRTGCSTAGPTRNPRGRPGQRLSDAL